VPGGEQPEQPNARRLMQGVLSRLRDAFESFRSGLKPTGLPSDPSQGAPDGSGPEVTPAGDAPRDDVRGAGGMPLADRLAAARAAFSGLGEHQEPGRRFERVG